MRTGSIRLGVGLLILSVLLSVLVSANNVTSADSTSTHSSQIRIGIIGDQTGSSNLAASYAVLQQGIQALQSENVQVVLHVGDLLESSRPVNEVRAQFAEATGMLDQLNAPWYMTAGDHDVNPPSFVPDSTDRSREALFQELYGARVPEVLDHPYYSFDVNNFHFISLYSHETLHADPRWGDIFMARVSDAQYEWLADDLEENESKPIVVFIHQPLWYHWSGWMRVHQLLRQYSVVAVIGGHFHYDQDEGRIDGIRYITVGATGGTVKQGHRDAGSTHHVSVIRLEIENSRPKVANIRLIPLNTPPPLRLTPRIDMDRVQAIDIVLGELWNFAQQNPVFLKDGELVNACEGGTPAVVQFSPIGNPIDLPMKATITFSSDSENIELDSPGFVPGQCDLMGGGCVLKKGARVWSSNLSSVSVDPFAGPLWQTNLALVGSELPPDGTALNFNIRLSFQGQQTELYLERNVTTNLSVCGQ